VELRIRDDLRVSDQQSGLNMWILRDQAPDYWDDGIVGICSTEHDLVVRIVQPECRLQRFFDEILDSAYRSQDAHATDVIPHGCWRVRICATGRQRSGCSRNGEKSQSCRTHRQGESRSPSRNAMVGSDDIPMMDCGPQSVAWSW